MSKKLIVAIVIILGLVGAGGTFVALNNNKTVTPEVDLINKPEDNVISYSGQDGKTALELLKQEIDDVEISGEGEMAFVTAINGIASEDNKYWMFFINGQSAEVGAGSYITKNSDVIKWELTAF